MWPRARNRAESETPHVRARRKAMTQNYNVVLLRQA